MKDEIAYQVLRSRDYDKFHIMPGNRETDKRRVALIKSSLQSVGFRKCPIIVNSKFEIIDGQGRFYALMELNEPIDYVIDEFAGVNECIKMNTTSTRWKADDYINSYTNLGNENFSSLKLLRESFPMFQPNEIIGVAKRIIVVSGRSREEIVNGTMQLSEEEVKRAKIILPILVELNPYIKKVVGQKRQLRTIVAWCLGVEKVDQKRFIEMIKSKYPKIDPVCDTMFTLRNLSDIYNENMRKEYKIHFDSIYRDET